MKNKLDLHGVRHQNVPREVDKFIGEHLLKGTGEVSIITGHSEQMRDIVNKTLGDYGLYSETNFIRETILSVRLR
jgi:dsDNA-specific endonuclease/ATPase MutS2